MVRADLATHLDRDPAILRITVHSMVDPADNVGQELILFCAIAVTLFQTGHG